MKRLTEKDESPCTCCGGIGSCRTDCSYKQIYDRLAEYEDTGLTPEDIQEAVDLFKDWKDADIPKELKSWVERCTWHVRKCEELLRELDKYKKVVRELQSRLYEASDGSKQAEEQGLLVRLPCKLGEKVYWIMECSCQNIDGVYSKCEFYGYEPDYGADCEICNRPEGTKCPHQYRISEGRANELNILMIARNLGKTVFLTREEAEKALEGA